jgi:hypothetical protein
MRRSPSVAIVAGLLLGTGALGAELISGEPRIVDGDTVQIGETKFVSTASTRRKPTSSVSMPRARSGPAASARVTSS